MRRRAAKEEAEISAGGGLEAIRVRVEDVYAVSQRARQDASLAPLAASIARHGLLQPIVVRRNSEAGRYALVCGARRLAACRMLGIREIDALCLDADALTAAACLMEEHLTRLPPGVMEEAQMISATDAEALLGSTALDRQMILRRLRLLELPETVQRIIRERGLSLEQAEPLLCARGEERQIEAALIIAERSLTPVQARRLVLGPRRQDQEPGAGRRRAVRLALEEVGRIAGRMRAQGVEANVSVHSQEGGMCVQIVFAHGEKPGKSAGI